MWCDTCGFLVEACRSAQLERCADCNGPIVEGYCDCDCDEDDYDDFRDTLLTGYGSVRDIDVTHLDDFIALRQFAFQIWYTGMAQVNPAFAARVEKANDWSHAMLDLVAAGYA